MLRFSGVHSWDDKPTQLGEVILRDNGSTLAIDFINDGWAYSAVLKQTGIGHYSGEWTARKGGENDQGQANARLFQVEDGLLLFGRWIEDNTTFTWWAELTSEE